MDFESKWYQQAAAIGEKHKVSLSFRPCAVYLFIYFLFSFFVLLFLCCFFLFFWFVFFLVCFFFLFFVSLIIKHFVS